MLSGSAEGWAASPRGDNSQIYSRRRSNQLNRPPKHLQQQPQQFKSQISSEENPLGSVGSFVLSMLVYAFRKMMFLAPHHKLTLYGIVIFGCSFLCSINFLDRSGYMANKRNIMNVFFVKNGWFWTLMLGCPFIVLSQCLVSAFNVASVARAGVRMTIATAFWFGITHWFEKLEIWTGSHCVNRTSGLILLGLDKYRCSRVANATWNRAGIDLSGHVFLITYSLVVLCEEAQPYVRLKTNLNARNDRYLAELRRRVQFYADVSFVLLGLLCVIWESMLVSTCLYFHTFLHKLIAFLITIGIWSATYQFYYLMPTIPNPGIP